jgi:hypothetical protein
MIRVSLLKPGDLLSVSNIAQQNTERSISLMPPDKPAGKGSGQWIQGTLATEPQQRRQLRRPLVFYLAYAI